MLLSVAVLSGVSVSFSSCGIFKMKLSENKGSRVPVDVLGIRNSICLDMRLYQNIPVLFQ